jgi:hypothetical protein
MAVRGHTRYVAEILAPVQNALDEVLRQHLAIMRQEITDEETVSPDALLGGWCIVTDWIDPLDGEHWYYRLCSPSLPPHSRIGLLQIGLEIED